MNTTIRWRAALLVAIVLAWGTQGLAHAPVHRLGGEIDDYTAQLDTAGPWHISGKWSLTVKGRNRKADFSVALSMVRSQNSAPGAHTHHVFLSDGEVTPLANGFSVSGAAMMTSNGNLAGFSGSPVVIQVTGGNALVFSNVTVTFGDGAVAHFGDQPLHGVVTSLREPTSDSDDDK